MGADQPADHGGLGLTQLGELRGDVRDRAMVLTQLASAGQARRRGSVTLAGQRPGQSLRPGEAVGPGDRDRLGTAFLESGELILGECRDRSGTAAASEMAQRSERQVVVGVRKAFSSHDGQGEHSSGTAATTAGLVRGGLPLDPALGLERIEVPAYRGGRDPELAGKVRCTERPFSPEQVDHSVAGTTVVHATPANFGPQRSYLTRGQDGGFHNNSVTYFDAAFHLG